MQARAIRAGAQAGALALLAPDLIYAELGNVVWKQQTFQGLAAGDGQRIIDIVRTLPFVTTPTATLLEDAYRMAIAQRCSVYDALYIALSVREGCPLVTADERLVHSVEAAVPHVIWLGVWSPPAPPAASGGNAGQP